VTTETANEHAVGQSRSTVGLGKQLTKAQRIALAEIAGYGCWVNARLIGAQERVMDRLAELGFVERKLEIELVGARVYYRYVPNYK
jgi:hypothetical protein